MSSIEDECQKILIYVYLIQHKNIISTTLRTVVEHSTLLLAAKNGGEFSVDLERRTRLYFGFLGIPYSKWVAENIIVLLPEIQRTMKTNDLITLCKKVRTKLGRKRRLSLIRGLTIKQHKEFMYETS